jgi:hypothetical protein
MVYTSQQNTDRGSILQWRVGRETSFLWRQILPGGGGLNVEVLGRGQAGIPEMLMKPRHINVFGMLFILLQTVKVSRSQQTGSVGVARTSSIWYTPQRSRWARDK